MTRTARGPSGFTLLELLVALALFALVAAMGYGGLSAMVRAQDGLRAQSERLAALQLAVGLLERDLRQAVPRPIRDRAGEQRAALSGQSRALELSALAPASAIVLTRPSLQRVGYFWDQKRLVRQTYAVLDRAPGTQAQNKVLMEDVEDVTLRYLSRERQWFDAWPARSGGQQDPQALPLAIELRLRLADYGTIRRVLVLPDVPLESATGLPPGTPPPGGTP